MSCETRGPLKTAHGLEVFTSRTADMLRLSGHVSAAAPCESIGGTADAAKPHDEGLGLVLSKLNIQGGSVQCHKSSGIPEPESSPSTDQSDFIADISIPPNGSQTNVRTFKLTR